MARHLTGAWQDVVVLLSPGVLSRDTLIKEATRPEVLRFLCDTPSTGGIEESCALFHACRLGCFELVHRFLSHDGAISPSWFCPAGHPAAGEILLFFGGIDPWNWESASILEAADAGHVHIVRHLLDWLRAHPDHDNPIIGLSAAVRAGLTDCVEDILDSGSASLDEPLHDDLQAGAHGLARPCQWGESGAHTRTMRRATTRASECFFY